MDASGNWLWATKAGGTSNDYGYSIALDDVGNTYVTGFFQGTATFGSTTITSSGFSDIFVAKMDTNGNWLWAKNGGGTSDDSASSITLDDYGNTYLTGRFQGAATFGSATLTSSGDIDIFVAKMDVNGNWLWATKAGGIDYDEGESISLDNAGNAHVTGYFTDTATFGSTSLTSSGNQNIFVAKLKTDFSANFTVNDTSGYLPFNVVFTDNSQGNPTSWQWDFENDGIIDSYEENPTHIYYNEGVYSVKLIIADSTRVDTLIKENYITVSKNPNPVIWVTPDTLAFGDTPVGGNKTMQITVTNYGEADLNITNILPSTSRYTVSLPRDVSFILSSMESKNVNVTFTPDEFGEINGQLIFFSNDPDNNPYYSYLTGNGIEQTHYLTRTDTTQIDFGVVYLTSQSADSLIVLENTGNMDVTINSLSFINGSNAFVYTYNNTVIPAGVKDTVMVKFHPQTTGVFSDTLLISNNSTDNPNIKIPLTGNCQYAPPKTPENITLTINGNDAVITWDAVTENIYNQAITPDGYIVLYSEDPNGDYYFLYYQTSGLSYTHQTVAQWREDMFYNVVAVIENSREEGSYLKNLTKNHKKILYKDIKRYMR